MIERASETLEGVKEKGIEALLSGVSRCLRGK